MRRITVFTDASDTIETLRRCNGGQLLLRFAPLALIGQTPPDHNTIIEADLTDTARLLQIKQWLGTAPSLGEVIFVTARASRLETKRARAIGATHVLAKPITMVALQQLFGGGGAAAPEAQLAEAQPRGVRQASTGLHDMFASAVRGERVEVAIVAAASNEAVREIEAHGLRSWVDAVRSHHTQTYQHCLLVTGVAVAFAQRLGFSLSDRQKLSLAAMLHDVGKARVPLAILEKPAALDAEEMALMRQHPRFGVEALQGSDFPLEMLDVVLHHHEYLDGSGYPNGLQQKEIPDLVRMVTIADVFGALIEARAYKPPLPRDKAYSILREMGGKLDADLVRAFGAALKLA